MSFLKAKNRVHILKSSWQLGRPLFNLVFVTYLLFTVLPIYYLLYYLFTIYFVTYLLFTLFPIYYLLCYLFSIYFDTYLLFTIYNLLCYLITIYYLLCYLLTNTVLSRLSIHKFFGHPAMSRMVEFWAPCLVMYHV